MAGFALPTKRKTHMKDEYEEHQKRLERDANRISIIWGVFWITIAILLIGFPSFSHASTLVSPYYRGDTFVDPYYRTDADSNPYNNYGFPGNYNPNTGQITSGNPDTYLSNYYGIKNSGSSNTSLYKLLNSGGLKTVPLPDPSVKLLKAQEDFQNKLDQERRTIEDRLYQLQLQNSTGIFASCVYPSSLGCTSESQYSSMRASDGATGLLTTDVSNSRLSQCRSQIDTYQQKLNQYNQCISNTQNQALDSIADKAVEVARLEKESAYYKSLLAYAMSCKTDHGQYGYYNSGINRCECITGFAPDANSPYQCIPLNVWCKIESGVGATNRIDTYVERVNTEVVCKCESGYQWDAGNAQCLQTATPDSALETTTGFRMIQPALKTSNTFNPADFGATPVSKTNAPEQPKKALTLSEIKAKDQRTNLIASTSSIIATSSINSASSTQAKSFQKQNIFQKLRTFFLGWWR